MPEIIIKNATVIDGSGAPAFVSDIGITGDHISHLAPDLNMDCDQVIDGAHMAVSPGFIDMHTHSDFTLYLCPGAESRIRQGVTTEVTGNCGGSPGPIRGPHRDAFMEYMTDLGRYYKRMLSDREWSWESLDEFYEKLSEKGTALNVAPLVGHSTLRSNVMGYANRPPDAEELKRMQGLLRDELEKGAFGLSSGLIYHPGAFAQAAELSALATVLPEYDGIYATHMRSEGKFLFEAVDEAIAVARKSGASLQISHLKCETPARWGMSGQLLENIDAAHQAGVNIHFDQYPYTAYSTSLIEIFPPWSKESGAKKLIERLGDPETRKRIADDMRHPPRDWDNPMDGLNWEVVKVTGFTCEENIHLNGMRMHEIADALDCDPIEAIFRIFSEEQGGLVMIVFAMSEPDLEAIMRHPLGMIGSDGCSMTPEGLTGKFPVHPRFYGTFPRVLSRYVRERKIIPLEQAVRKMTGLPAEKLGLKDRGLIREGMAADLVVFDPAAVRDKADFTAPHQFPEGIAHVFVNGQAVVMNGEHTGLRPGKRLYKNRT